MDIASLAASAAIAQRTQTALAIQTELARLAHARDQALVALLANAAEAGKEASADVAGSAGIVDFKV